MNESDSQHSGIPSSRGFGKLLAEARKARGWTAGYAANQLRLPESTVLHLEAENFSMLPGDVYVRGYLRNYARLLRLSADELVAAYLSASRGDGLAVTRQPPLPLSAELRPPTNPHRAAGDGGLRDARTHHESGFRTLLGVALVIGIAYGLTWWWPDKGLPVDHLKSQLTDLLGLSHQSDARHAANVDFDEPEPTAASMSLSELHETSAATVASESETAPGDSANAAQPAEMAAVAAPSEQSSGDDVLILNFRGDSWATVFDAGGNRLMNQTGPKGSTKTLKGKAPFKLTIGRISEVTITMNGTIHALPNAEKRATERFSVPFAETP